jgi:anti-anti-sigma regulatory factor
MVRFITQNDILIFRLPKGCLQGDNDLFRFIANQSDLPESASSIEFDFEQIDYVNSLGVAELISIFRYLQRKYHQDISFNLTNVSQEIQRLLKIVEIDQFFRIYPSN